MHINDCLCQGILMLYFQNQQFYTQAFYTIMAHPI